MNASSVWEGTALRGALWLVLGTWVGAWLLFGLVVAPVAFRALPGPGNAGRLVSPILTALHLYGAGAGIALALLAWALRRGAPLVALPLLMSGLCLVSQFGVTPQIAEIRELVFGSGGDVETAARFGRLHRISMALFSVVGFGALALIGLHAHAESTAAIRLRGHRGLTDRSAETR